MNPNTTGQDSIVHDSLRDQLVDTLPPHARIRAHGWRPWASASFAGARHWFDLTMAGTESAIAADPQWAAREWPLKRSFVADVAVTPGDVRADDWRIEMLTVDDER